MLLIYNLFLAAIIVFNTCTVFADESLPPPENGYITDSRIAIALAEIILTSQLGSKIAESQKPFQSIEHKDSWLIKGTLPEAPPGKMMVGGVCQIEIAKSDARVIDFFCEE